MKKVVNFYKEPRIKPLACSMLAAWPGIGNVSLILAHYLKDKLKAEAIGEIKPFNFFEPIGVVIKENVVEAPQFPESTFYYWQNPAAGQDIIFFVGEAQPTFRGYELAHCVVDVARKFKVAKIFTCAAALARIHHTEKPRVWGVVTDKRLLQDLKKYDVTLRGDLHIAGLNGLLLGVAKEMGIDGICLLGEVPMYATRIPNPKASLAIAEVLIKMLGIKVELGELEELAKQSDEEMRKLAAEAMGEFIDHFTKPIWEGEEEE